MLPVYMHASPVHPGTVSASFSAHHKQLWHVCRSNVVGIIVSPGSSRREHGSPAGMCVLCSRNFQMYPEVLLPQVLYEHRQCWALPRYWWEAV